MRERGSIADLFSEAQLETIEPSCDLGCACEKCEAEHAFVLFNPSHGLPIHERLPEPGEYEVVLDERDHVHATPAVPAEWKAAVPPSISTGGLFGALPTSCTIKGSLDTLSVDALLSLYTTVAGLVKGPKPDRACVSEDFSAAELAALPTLPNDAVAILQFRLRWQKGFSNWPLPGLSYT